MTTPDSASGLPPDERLLRVWKAHLAQEETLLRATLDSLRRVRVALIGAQWALLPELLAFQDRLVEDAREIANLRKVLCEVVAPILGVASTDITLRTVTGWLDPSRRMQLIESRERLDRMVREAETLRDSIAALLRYSQGFFQKLLEGLTGGSVPSRYGPGGKWQGQASGALIQGRG